MRKEKNLHKRKNSFLAGCFVMGLVVVLLLIMFWGMRRVRQRLYAEQTYNLSHVMEKNSQNIGIVFQERWNGAYYCSRELCLGKYRTEEEILEKAALMESIRKEENLTCFLIDQNGICHTTGGEQFRWGDNSILSDPRDLVYVTVLPYLNREEEQIIFPAKLPKKITVGDNTYTYFALACGMSSLDPYFDVSDYGGKGTISVINRNGTYIYKQKKDRLLANGHNFVEFTKQTELVFSATGNHLEDDVEKGCSGCTIEKFKGVNYFVAYQKMDVNDWYAVLTVPENLVGNNSLEFMKSIMAYLGTIFVIVFFILVGIIVVTSRQIRRKQEVVNENLRKTAESQRNAAEAERRANVAKTQFLSSMSHDIRTPMNAIMGMTAIAMKKPEDSEHVRGCLQKISFVSSQLLTLINDILDISKVESGKMSMNPADFSLAELFRNLVDVVIPQVRSKKLRLDIHICNVERECLYADAMRLNQIFTNILTNAVKYTPDGGRITVSLREEVIPQRGDMIRLFFSVRDTGIGMSKEYMKTMYDAFSRVLDSRTSKIQGTGLGLAIVKKIVDLMKGRIECESEEGKGTCFTVVLDLPTAEVAEEVYELPAFRILLADDDRVFLNHAAETLQSMGAETDVVESGEEAVAKLRETDYSAAFIGISLSDMEGIEAVKKLRREAVEVPVVLVCTVMADVEDAAREAGVNAFANKLFFRSELYQHLNRLLNFGEIAAMDTDVLKAEDLNGMHLLVAEDNDLNWEIIEELLDSYGITAERAVNGQICVEKILSAEKGEYDMIFMDIQMPVMNGREASRKIRQSSDSYVRNIPIIAMTADAFADDIAACFEAGMDDHVSKPIDMKAVFRAMRKVMKKKES